MKFLSFKTLLPAFALCSMIAGASCTGNGGTAASAGDSTDSCKNEKSEQRQAKYTPAIDKSGDAYLQNLIKTVAPKFKQLEYTDASTGKKMKYNLYSPQKTENGKTYPLMLFMADASTAGYETTAPLTQGYGALVWATDKWQEANPCYVLVPQFSEVSVDDKYNHNDEADMVIRLLGSVAKENPVDMNRLYASGQSMGGMLAMYYNVAYPDLFAASMFVDSHWDNASFDKLVKHKFIYFVAGDKGKAYQCINAIENACRKEGVSYTTSEWDARLPEKRQDELASVMLEKGDPVNVFEFETGSVLPEGVKDSDHMYSFDFAYKNKAACEWLFRQKK